MGRPEHETRGERGDRSRWSLGSGKSKSTIRALLPSSEVVEQPVFLLLSDL